MALNKNQNRPAKAGWEDVRVRAFTVNDIEPVVEFIYRGPRESAFIQAINFGSWPSEMEYRQFLNDVARSPSLQPTVVVEYKGRTVGVHYLTDLMAGQADFQAFLFSLADCGKGIGAVSWSKAAEYFFAHFDLDTIHFRTPKDNPMASAAAKKLPLNFMGEEELRSPHIRPGLRARIYALSRSEFEALMSGGSSAGTEEGDEEELEEDESDL